jgi:Uma2 family endonuclease
MSLPVQPHRYTLEEYFEIERTSLEKHEYRNGEVVSINQAIGMAGGAIEHSQITVNVISAIGNRLKVGPCRVYSSDLRVRIPRKILWAYPDATVICGKPQVEHIRGIGDTVINPQVIVEVL